MYHLMKYQFNTKRGTWIVTKSQDSGLEAMMSVAGAKTFSLNKADGQHFYWEVPAQSFESVRGILNSLGYTEFGAADKQPVTSAGYQTRVSTSSPVAKTQPEEKTYSVKELSNGMNQAIMNAFPKQIWLRGEVTEIAESKGFHYLTVIDKDTAQAARKPRLSLVIFPNVYHDVILPKLTLSNMPPLKPGVEIRVYGRISYYPNKGEGSFEVQDIDPSFAEGELIKLKKRIEDQLYQMGIHDNNKSIPMPLLPLKLAVFSKMNFEDSTDNLEPKKNSARGCEDFINTLRASHYPFEITFFNVNLQGEFLESSFLKAFELLDNIGSECFDLGVIIRGGGSVLDLAGFNNLKLATYIAKSPLKFIVGIGHDKDRCVLDEIAHNEKTPTAIGDLLISILREFELKIQKAAENLSFFARRNLNDYKNLLSLQQERCVRLGNEKLGLAYNKLSEARYNLGDASRRLIQLNVQNVSQLGALVQQKAQSRIADLRYELESFVQQLEASADNIHESSQSDLNNYIKQLDVLYTMRLDTAKQLLEQYAAVLKDRVSDGYAREMQKVNEYKSKVELLNPSDIFKRGFASVSDGHGKRISTIQSVSEGDKVVVRLEDGKVHATVDSVEKC